jgi:hypothetical protein
MLSKENACSEMTRLSMTVVSCSEYLLIKGSRLVSAVLKKHQQQLEVI